MRSAFTYIAIAACVAAGILNLLLVRFWAAGLLFFGAAINAVMVAQGLRLRRQLAAADARRAELAQLELELVAATDDATRVRLLERLASFETLPVRR